ncbi:MAG: beta strand repeat-containing protein, partial [Dolichospermum sp.]
GNGGGITIDTSTLTIENTGIISANTSGKGNAGNIAIQASQGVNVRGRLTSDVKDTAQGNSGGITIDTATLTLENGGFINASTFGKGNAGKIEIQATEGVTVGGALNSRVTATGEGNSGGITIDTSTLTLENGGYISADTSGKGNAGNIAIRATEGVNVGGFLFSGVTDTGEGDGGDITIDTATLTLEKGGFINALTNGKGNAGNIAIQATQGVNVGGGLTSGVTDTAQGNSGGITIDTATLTLENGGFINASTFGKGNAGNVVIKATQGVNVGGLLTSGVTDTAVGDSGDITIDTATLTLENGGYISANTYGKGNAGNIAIKATQGVNVRENALISSTVFDTGEGDSGGITIDTSTLTLEKGGFISASTFGKGNAGNIAIKTTEGVTVGGFLTSGVFDTGEGNGGSITIDTSTLTLENDGRITTDTYGKGDAGNIEIQATEGVKVRGRLTSRVRATAVGNGGSITIDTSTLTLEKGGFISASTFGKGDAGKIEIQATQGVTIGGFLSSAVTDTGVGDSGSITIDTSTLTLENGGIISASKSGKGNAGDIAIKATQGVTVGGFLTSGVFDTGEGNGGSITIDTSTLTLEKGGLISADTFGKGDAGKIEIQATQGVTIGGFLSS